MATRKYKFLAVTKERTSKSIPADGSNLSGPVYQIGDVVDVIDTDIISPIEQWMRLDNGNYCALKHDNLWRAELLPPPLPPDTFILESIATELVMLRTSDGKRFGVTVTNANVEFVELP